jgi:hypothetical protein
VSGDPRPEILWRALLQPGAERDLRAAFEGTGERVHISPTVVCGKYGLRGVPMRHVDVLLDHDYDQTEGSRGHWPRVVEISIKRGRYDGAERDRITLRRWQTGQTHGMCGAEIVCQPHVDGLGHESWHVEVVPTCPASGHEPWVRSYPRLRSDLAGYDLHRIVLWHWTRHYRHLGHEDAAALSLAWAAEAVASGDLERWTLAEANRSASRALYRLSRDLGWRKLTLREQRRHELSGQWHREEDVLRARGVLGTPTGCGEATHHAAQGRGWDGTHPVPGRGPAKRVVVRKEVDRG